MEDIASSISLMNFRDVFEQFGKVQIANQKTVLKKCFSDITPKSRSGVNNVSVQYMGKNRCAFKV